MDTFEKYLESLGLRADKILKDRGYITASELCEMIYADMGLASCNSDVLRWPDEPMYRQKRLKKRRGALTGALPFYADFTTRIMRRRGNPTGCD